MLYIERIEQEYERRQIGMPEGMNNFEKFCMGFLITCIGLVWLFYLIFTNPDEFFEIISSIITIFGVIIMFYEDEKIWREKE